MNENEAEHMFDELLDECNPVVKIGTLEYSPSWVLKRVDPIAYRVGLSDYWDSMEEYGIIDDDDHPEPEIPVESENKEISDTEYGIGYQEAIGMSDLYDNFERYGY